MLTDPVCPLQLETVGTYASGETGAARKILKGCRVCYVGAPLLKNAAPLRQLFPREGVRSFVENPADGDAISVGGGIIGIYSVKGGERTIQLAPCSTRYLDLHSGVSL